MKRSVLLLLATLIFLSLGANDVFVGCGLGGGGSSGFACTTGGEEDPCDYIVTVQVTVLLASISSPLQGVTVTIGNELPDAFNTRLTDQDGHASWDDTSFITGFSANCSDRNVGTVEPYHSDTSFSHDVLVSASGLSPFATVLTIDRNTRDVGLTVRMEI
jgi:hypothetical protein